MPFVYDLLDVILLVSGGFGTEIELRWLVSWFG